MPEAMEELTAAECASRTGLTVRALRVYEDQGLIAPRRTPAGWRIYGTQELIKLNEIGLLKVLGLTLGQIRELMHKPSPPGLSHLLELQLGTLRRQRGEVEQGLAAVEAALQRLHVGARLSVETLCSLIRSCEMDASAVEAGALVGAEPASPATATQDRFVGHYRRGKAPGVSTITRKGAQLFLEPLGQPSMELEQIGDAEFALRSFELVLRFEQIEEAVAQRLVIWQRGAMLKLARIEPDAAARLAQSIAQRIESRTPVPGSEQALRRLIDAGRTGTAEVDLLAADFAPFLRAQLPYWHAIGQYFGAIVSIDLLGVSPQGWDLFRVQHENDVHRYRIAMGEDGEVYGFSEASAEAERRALI